MTNQNTARRLRDSVRHLMVAHSALEEVRRPCGVQLSIPHAYALLELLQQRVPMTVSELAAKLMIGRTNVSRLTIRMEEAGEIERAPHPDDGRARALVLTLHGKNLARSVDEASVRHFAKLARRLAGGAGTVIHALEQLEQIMIAAKEDE